MRTTLFLIQKEALQVLRDRVMLLQILLMPLLQLLVLSQAATFEVHHTRVALVDLDRSPASARLVARFEASGRFGVAQATASGAAADRALDAGEVGLVLRIPEGFERALRRRGGAEVQLVLNAEDGAAAGVVQAYAGAILRAFARDEGRTIRSAGPAARAGRASGGPALEIRTRGLYNPEGGYLDYMAFGFLASLVTVIGVLLTAQNIAREKEIGTLEQLNVTPITRAQFIAGKLLPFWVLGLIELTLGLGVIKLAFGTPFAGNLAIVYLAAAVYLVATLGLGLLVSTVVTTQQQAQFVTFFVLVFFFFLGGIFTPVQSMPGWVRVLAEINPIKHFVVIIRGVLMKGAPLGDVLVPLGAMAAFGVAVLTLAVFRYRKTAA